MRKLEAMIRSGYVIQGELEQSAALPRERRLRMKRRLDRRAGHKQGFTVLGERAGVLLGHAGLHRRPAKCPRGLALAGGDSWELCIDRGSATRAP